MRRAGPFPEGFLYRPAFLAEDEERALAAEIARLPLAEIRMHGVTAKRRAAHYGWLFGYESWRISPGPPIPDFLPGVLPGSACSDWQHGIPPTNELRYSVTFRTLRRRAT